MKFFIILLTGLFLILLSVQTAVGCQCSSIGPACSQFSRANAVFVGRVEKVDLKESSYSIIHFKVEQNLKGMTETTIKVGYNFRTSCSTTPDAFKENEKWLVYGYIDEDILTIPICTGSHPISDDGEDLNFIKDFRDGKTNEFVWGLLVKGRYDKVMNGSVTVTRKNKIYKTKLYSGFFVTQVSGEGIYRVKVTVPFKAEVSGSPFKIILQTKNKTIVEYETKVEKGLCSFQELNFYD